MSLDDAKRSEVVLSATGAGSTGSLYPNVMNEVLKTRFKLVQGYKGTHEAMLALERGEAEGHSTTWEAVKSVNMRWVREGTDPHPRPARPQPRARPARRADLGRACATPEDRAVMRAIMGTAEIGKSYFTTPEVPRERVAALRRAFDAMVNDPAFVEEVKKVHGEVEPMTGRTDAGADRRARQLPAGGDRPREGAVQGVTCKTKHQGGLP